MGGEPEVVEGGTATVPATDGTGFGALIARVVGVLAFILGLLYVSLLGMKKVMSRNQAAVGGQIQVLGRTPLSQKANVYLLRFRDRYLIVGEAGERLTSLASMPAGESPEIEDADTEYAGGGGLEDIFSTAGEDDGVGAEDDRMMAKVGEGVKKLRQETENLLKIHMGAPGSGAGPS
jgi:flagellar biogenesis protein FliO